MAHKRSVPLIVVFTAQFLTVTVAFCAVTAVLLIGQRTIINNAIHDTLLNLLLSTATMVANPLKQHARDLDTLTVGLLVNRAALPDPPLTPDTADTVLFNLTFASVAWNLMYVMVYASKLAGTAYENACLRVVWNASQHRFLCQRFMVAESGCSVGYCYSGRNRTYIDIDTINPMNGTLSADMIPLDFSAPYWYDDDTKTLDDNYYINVIFNISYPNSNATANKIVTAWSHLYTWGTSLIFTRYRCIRFRQDLPASAIGGDPLPSSSSNPVASLPGISCMHTVNMDIDLSYVQTILNTVLPIDLLGTVSLIDLASSFILGTTTSSPTLCDGVLCSAWGPSSAPEIIDGMKMFQDCAGSTIGSRCGFLLNTDALNRRFVVATQRIVGDEAAGSMIFLLIVAVDRSHYYGVSDDQLKISVITACVAIVSTLAITVSISLSISLSVRSLVKNFAYASILENDKVVVDHSSIRELEDMHRKFRVLNERLKLAKAFLPEAVVLQAGATLDVDDDDSSSGQPSTSASSILTLAPVVPRPPLNGDHDNSNAEPTGGILAPLENQPAAAVELAASPPSVFKPASVPLHVLRLMSDALSPKSVAVLMANMWDFERMLDEHAVLAIRAHAWVLQQLVVCVKEHNGVVDSFHGDHFMATFNASVDCGGPVQRAADTIISTLIALRSEVKKPIKDFTRENSLLIFRGISFGMSEGLARCGTIGTSTMQRPSVIGRCVNEAHALMMYCRVDRLTNCISSTALSKLPPRQHIFQHVAYGKLPRAERGTLFTSLIGFYPSGSGSGPVDLKTLNEDNAPGMPPLNPLALFESKTSAEQQQQLEYPTVGLISSSNTAFQCYAEGNFVEAQQIANRYASHPLFRFLRRELAVKTRTTGERPS